VGAARAVQDLLQSRHDALAVRYADRNVKNRIVGVQHEHDKYDGHRARGLSRDKFPNLKTPRAKTTSPQEQIENSDFFFSFLD